MLQAAQKLLCQLKLVSGAAAGMTTLEDARVALQQWLRDRHMLVILDDVWDTRIPGLFTAADCQLLVTAEQRSVCLPDTWQAVNLTPQMVHDSGVAAAILDAHNISREELVSSSPASIPAHVHFLRNKPFHNVGSHETARLIRFAVATAGHRCLCCGVLLPSWPSFGGSKSARQARWQHISCPALLLADGQGAVCAAVTSEWHPTCKRHSKSAGHHESLPWRRSHTYGSGVEDP